MCMLEEKIAILLLQTKKNDGVFGNSKIFFSKAHQNYLNKTGINKEDERRFCLLHKMLSQSINIFNLKMLIDSKQL